MSPVSLGSVRDRLLSRGAVRTVGRVGCVTVAILCGVLGLAAGLDRLPLIPPQWSAGFVALMLSLTILCLLLMVWWSDRQGRRMSERVIEIEQARRWSDRRLSEIIEASSESIVVYDASDRLVLCNAAFRDAITAMGDTVRYGVTHEEGLRRAVDLGGYAGVGDREIFIAQQKAALRTPGKPTIVQLAGGRWVRLSNKVLPDGSVLGIRSDVTDLKQREVELADSQAQLSRLFATLADVVLELSANGVITYANPASYQVLGFDPDDLDGMRLDELFPPGQRLQLTEMRRRLSEGATESEAVVLYTKPSGEPLHVEVRLWLSDRSTGEQVITATIRDVDDREKAAALAAREGALLTSIANASGAYMIVLDGGGNLVRGNTAFYDLIHRDARDMEGRPLSALEVTKPLAAIVEPAIRDGGVSGFPFEFDVVLRDRRDARHTMRFSASAVPEVDRSLRYAVLVGIDDTARRNAETALFEAAKLSKLGEMAAAMAHELNQPLAVIRMAAENTLDEIDMDPPPDAAMADFLRSKLRRIADQTDRAAKVIGQLRAHARKGDDLPAPFDVPEAVNGALDLLREQLKLDGIRVAVVSAACPPIVGHRSRFEQVVINLMINARDAIKMVPDARVGARTGQIDVIVTPNDDNSRVRLALRDNGPGIPPHALERLFEPFFTTKPKDKGTGLGLSICHSIVAEMGGALSAHNHPDGGAVFEIDVPAVSSRSPAVDRQIAPAA
ncbi:MAG TPA: PAS domain S-box protein [Vineibacter sp.]|nr:PAS domain S-box protein [Vineibacter sp.]